jgi:HAD superfamily hydrolase (TIGR01509 family)
VILGQRLQVPDGTKALLVDMDGVIVDTLTLEYEVVGDLLGTPVPREVIREAFPYPIPDAWRRILATLGETPTDERIEELTERLEQERATRTAPVHEGIPEILAAATENGLATAVVSNNPLEHIYAVLDHAGIRDHVAHVVGNDGPGVRSKPAPDPYLKGAEAVGAPPETCVAIEDSLLGARSGRAAGCHVVGVATGAATFDELSRSTDVDAAYERFAKPAVQLTPGNVRNKRLHTPNEFVTHMLEHVAWRLGCEVDLQWPNDDWRWLGEATGRAVAPLLDGPESAEALGMIDDGSAEVRVTRGAQPHAELTGAGVDVDWFTSLRVEQLDTGAPLVELLDGLSAGAAIEASVVVTSLEDPHHTWEAVWRGVGVALRGLSATLGGRDGPEAPVEASAHRATAETECDVTLSLARQDVEVEIETSRSVDASGLADLLERFARAAQLGIQVRFHALKLSSSHVAAEDIGMTLGIALKQLASERMAATGIEGAGSSLNGRPRPIRVGISFEGRKFVRFVPVGWGQDDLRRTIIGQTLSNGLFSEDLDDFVDGFAGGMGASVIVHWEPTKDPDEAWRMLFEGLGAAVRQLLQPNPARRGVIAGVKETLA